MKIGLMGGWNTDSGASLHTELVGRAWKKMGHEVNVFTFYRESFHGTNIIGNDENYVTRCFTVSGAQKVEMNPVPLLTADYDVFVTEDLGMLPMDHLGRIFSRIKKKAKTVTVIHDGDLARKASFYQDLHCC